MKRLLSMALAILISASCFSGCASASSGRQVCLDFLSCISEMDYIGAYQLLDEGIKLSSDEENLESRGKISEKQFVAKYSNIFAALEISSVVYENIEIDQGDIFTIANFTGTYSSALAGDITGEYRMVALKVNGEWCIEWAPDLIFPEMEWGDTVRVATISAQRGEIISDGHVLATKEGKISVYAMPGRISDTELENFLIKTSALLGMTRQDIQKAMDKAYDGVAILKQYYQDDFPPYLETQLLEVTGIGIDYGNYGSVRSYPEKDMLSHTIGYVGIVNAPDAAALDETLAQLNEGRTAEDGLYNSDSYVGRNGLEAQYERELRGKDGYRIYICTPAGTNRRTLYTKEQQDGKDLQLTINYELQKRLDFVLDSVLYGETTAGAVIVMNPVTGAIDAMSSWPGYDLKSFARGISAADYNALLSMANTPLYNRLTQGLYPPGSVLKAFTAVAALQTATLDENYVFEGEIEEDYWLPTEFGTWLGSRIKRTEVKYGRMSPLNMRSAIVHSDNIYFANASLLLGWDNYENYMTSIGFGDNMPFDLNVATSQLYNEGTELSLMLLAESGYGQGELLTTPLQMAVMFSAFANGGNIMQPYIVESLCETKGITYDTVSATEPRLWKSGVIDQASLDIVVPYLQDVVDHDLNGTGRSLKVNSVQVAAKTGTAEIGNDKSREISWFAGFRCGVEPADARLVLVMLEVPTEDEFQSLKFDVARELLKMSAP
ncbi:MAG: hypothetical protein IJN08_05130 [Clostridia bacterium]|nr:hypothetical protein [Clostridia bacterium]